MTTATQTPTMPASWHKAMEKDANRHPTASARAACREKHRQQWWDYYEANKGTPEFRYLYPTLT